MVGKIVFLRAAEERLLVPKVNVFFYIYGYKAPGVAGWVAQRA